MNFLGKAQRIVIAAAGALALTAAGASLANAAPGGKLVGAWNVSVMPEGAPFTVPNTVTISSDGTMNNGDPSFGAGHGVWEKVGPNSYAISFMHVIDASASPIPPAGGANVFLTVDGLLSLDSSGNVASGPFHTVFRDEGGAEILSFGGEVQLTRYSLPEDIALFDQFFTVKRKNK